MGAPAIHAQAAWNNVPEKGATRRVLRWSRFVQGDIDAYMANVKKFTENRAATLQRLARGRPGDRSRLPDSAFDPVHPAGARAAEPRAVQHAVVTELVEGDVYPWGLLMAGALLGSLPVAVFYSLFVEYYVAGMTGAVKE